MSPYSRITRRLHAAAPLDGEGARLFGSRWNHPGTPLASTSTALSLAALEYLVHVDPEDLPDDLVQVKAIVPDAVVPLVLNRSKLPAGWRAYPAADAVMNVGDAWLREATSLLLCVPSAVIPEETNVLVNPRHPDFPRIRVDGSEPFWFDSRVFK
jgi:RES domain-containing protein